MFVGFSCFPMDSPHVFVCLPGHMIWCWQTSESLGWDPMFQLAVKEWYSSPRRNIIWYIYIYYIIYYIIYIYNHIYIINMKKSIWKNDVYLIFNSFYLKPIIWIIYCFQTSGFQSKIVKKTSIHQQNIQKIHPAETICNPVMSFQKDE